MLRFLQDSHAELALFSASLLNFQTLAVLPLSALVRGHWDTSILKAT